MLKAERSDVLICSQEVGLKYTLDMGSEIQNNQDFSNIL